MSRIAHVLVLTIVCAAGVAVSCQPAFAKTTQHVYVSLAGEDKIVLFSLDGESGELRRLQDFKVEGQPGPLTTDPKRQFLFASLRRAGKLASFRLEADGGLRPISVIDAGADPAYLATDRSGRWLFSAYYAAGKAAVHAIGEDGSLDEKSGVSYPTAEKAHAILADPTNRFVYVPHTGPNRVYQFRFDAQTGRLTPNSPPFSQFEMNTGPRHLAFYKDQPLVFFDNEQGSSVTLCRWNDDGVLSPLQTVSTLPEDFTGQNSCADLHLHPSGRFLYCSNRGHDSLARFAVSEGGESFRSLGQTATEKTPRSFDIDPTGRFLIAAGQGSGKLAAYRIDPQTGDLNRYATIEVGAQPWWVLILPAGK